MTEILKTEVETFERHRGELLGRASGDFALVHDSEIVGTYKSKEDAIAEGYRRLGNVPFLVKQILAVDLFGSRQPRPDTSIYLAHQYTDSARLVRYDAGGFARPHGP